MGRRLKESWVLAELDHFEIREILVILHDDGHMNFSGLLAKQKNSALLVPSLLKSYSYHVFR